MVEPASEIHGVADLTEKEQNLVRRPAHSEAAAHHQRRDGRVAAGLLCHRRARRIHLKQRFDWTSWPIFQHVNMSSFIVVRKDCQGSIVLCFDEIYG